ncbi:hypothetical protein D3P96_07960 [Weissella viridescens]|uniref:Uncharacterized protein n=1 Tax=Weissella viridescens TaxID=1629 RepID=A0A3P2R9G8_WEIVI|nr:hypothetical protein D3P96_07960 [Weissella viridescens]
MGNTISQEVEMFKKLTNSQCYHIAFALSALFFTLLIILVALFLGFQSEWMKLIAYFVLFILGMVMSGCIKRLNPNRRDQ